MKKVSIFMMAAIVAASSVFISCSKDDPYDPKEGPVISVKLGDVDVANNGTVKVKVRDAKDLVISYEADGGIKEITVTGGSLTAPTFSVGDLTAKAEKSFTFSTVEKIVIETTITDNQKAASDGTDTPTEDKTATFKFTIDVEAYGAISSWSDKLLGSFTEKMYGSSFASSTGTVYTLTNATANSALIDFIYSDGATFAKTLVAPSVNNEITALNSSAVRNWTTRNATKFGKLTVTTAQFDGCNDDALITANVTDAAVKDNIISDLNKDDIVGFTTAAGKKGLIKVGTIVQTVDTKSMAIFVKVQK